jgi:hypothetical protein
MELDLDGHIDATRSREMNSEPRALPRGQTRCSQPRRYSLLRFESPNRELRLAGLAAFTWWYLGLSTVLLFAGLVWHRSSEGGRVVVFAVCFVGASYGFGRFP